jgi:serine/threonine protein kinase
MYICTDILCVHVIRFSEKSDVWAFGVTAWEILTGGKEPYNCTHLDKVMSFVCGGGRLERKDLVLGCTDALWAIISSCFNVDATKRPTFALLVMLLASAMAETQNTNMNTSAKRKRDDSDTSYPEMNGSQTQTRDRQGLQGESANKKHCPQTAITARDLLDDISKHFLNEEQQKMYIHICP